MSDIIRAHKHSSNHRAEVEASRVCGCFHCLKTFSPTRIAEWIDWPDGTAEDRESDQGATAMCPDCGIDSVLGDKSGYEISTEFLSKMQKHWFGAHA